MHKHILFLTAICLGACKTEEKQDPLSLCEDPQAVVGEDQTIALGQTATISASDSTWCDGRDEGVTVNWSFVSVPSESSVTDGSLSDNRSRESIAPQFLPDVVGEYVLSVQIQDGVSSSSEAFVVVTVQAGDLMPTADCGGPYSGRIQEMVNLDGSASSDPEQQLLEYEWSLASPGCSALTSDDLYNESGPSPVFVPDCDGSYIVSLVVSDGNQWSNPAVCSVDVASSNRIPVADAGSSQVYGGCSNSELPLNGYGSYDLDGDQLTYEWSVVTVPQDSMVDNNSISDRSSPNPMFDWDIAGAYTLQLQVMDGDTWSAPDLVNLDIQEINENNRPIANAGENQDISVTANCQESTSYTSSECSDCAPTNIILDGTGSIDPNGDQLTFLWEEETGELENIGSMIAMPQSAISDVMIPAQDYSSGQSAINYSFQFVLTVSDCERFDDDTVYINYSCSGN
jgi:hypothetical protein